MCDPLSISAVTTAVSMASAGMAYIGQNQQAAANQQAANVAYAQNENSAQQRYTQIGQEQSENTVNAAIARAKAQGGVSASASSFGFGEDTTGRLSQAADFASGRQLSLMDVNSENQRVATGDQEQANWLNRQSQINSVMPGNPLALGVNLAGDAAKGAADYSKMGGRY